MSSNENREFGLVYDKFGNLRYVNANIFVSKFVERYDIAKRDMGSAMRYYRYTGTFWQELNERKIKQLMFNFLNTLEPDQWNRSLSRELMEVLPLISQNVKGVEKGQHYICVKNGLFNIDTLALTEHRADIFPRFRVTFGYEPSEKCPRFKQFLRDSFSGDEERVRLVQEILGCILSYRTDAQRFFVFYSDGGSGKSLLTEILVALVGGVKNTSTVTLEDLGKNFARSELEGKILNIASESDVGYRFSTSALKAISSGDYIQIEKKNEQPYTHKISTKLVFCLNALPSPKDRGYAYFRRLLVVPFDKRFVENPTTSYEGEDDKNLKERLLSEIEGIFAFAIRGLKRLMKNRYNFTKSKVCELLTQEYQIEVNPTLHFVKECIVATEDGRLRKFEIHETYRAWCHLKRFFKAGDVKIITFMREFRAKLKDEHIDFDPDFKSNGKRYLKGIAFSESALRVRCEQPHWLSQSESDNDIEL